MKEPKEYSLTFQLEEVNKTASEFLKSIGDRKVIAFNGEMGAGKTTFIAELCRILGADDDFGSPTFSIVNEYLSEKGEPIYHFDFYRIKAIEEAFDMGASDYFRSGSFCFLEWADRIEPLLPEDILQVDMNVNDDGSRTLSYSL